MDVNDMLEEFMKNKSGGSEGYRKDIKIFFSFLKSKEMPLIKEILQGVRTKNIIESITYYKDNKKLDTESTASRYSSAISEFFKYIIGNNYIENKDFYEELTSPTTISKSYLYRMNDYISKDKDLKEKDTFKIFEDEEVKDLIKNCDYVLSGNIESVLLKSKEYNKFLSALCIKLITFNGIMYRELREIKITNDISKFNKICINNFRITLPDNYNQQLKKYLKIRNEILIKNNKESEYLFITYNGEKLPGTTIISGFLTTCTGRNDFNGLIKYAIRNMITAGINDSVIERLTGASKELIRQASYNENLKDEIYWNRYLDSRMRNIELFDLL